jgi:hypothetical protein
VITVIVLVLVEIALVVITVVAVPFVIVFLAFVFLFLAFVIVPVLVFTIGDLLYLRSLAFSKSTRTRRGRTRGEWRRCRKW